MQVTFLAPARSEFREAVTFYNRQRGGLGLEFADEVKRTVERIIQYPEAWSLISERTRRCRVNRFPFGVIYQIRDDVLLIVAVMQLHREPNSWRDRLQESPA